MIQSVFPAASMMLYNSSKQYFDVHQETLNATFREEQREKVKEVCKLVSLVQNHGTTLSVFPHPDRDKDDFKLRILIEWTSDSGYYFTDWMDIDSIEVDLNDGLMKGLSDIIKSRMEEWKYLQFYRIDNIEQQQTYNDLIK